MPQPVECYDGLGGCVYVLPSWGRDCVMNCSTGIVWLQLVFMNERYDSVEVLI